MQKRKEIDGYPYVSYTKDTYEPAEMIKESHAFHEWMENRRTVREFSDRPIPKEVIDNILMTASSAPSGAHKQPWTFCVVSNPDMKKKIRKAAENEEKESYTNRMSDEWIEALRPLGTDWQKPFLEIAPYLIIVFKKAYDKDDEVKKNNYYVSESVGLASGFLLTAIHHAGLVALTHTPSPMNFLTKLLDRPENERPFLLIPVGYPTDEMWVWVPDLKRKSLEDIAVYYE